MLKKWWDGEFVPYENDPRGGVMIIGGTYRRHWSASALRAVVGFLQKEWKWAIGTLIAVVGIALATL